LLWEWTVCKQNNNTGPLKDAAHRKTPVPRLYSEASSSTYLQVVLRSAGSIRLLLHSSEVMALEIISVRLGVQYKSPKEARARQATKLYSLLTRFPTRRGDC
jgi:hypothetical protein